MKEKLLKLANNSYSPYSHYRVATILIMKDGKCLIAKRNKDDHVTRYLSDIGSFSF